MSEDTDDKPLDPTAQKLKQARRKGDVPSSPEAQTFARFAGIAVAVLGLSGGLALSAGQSLMPYWDRPWDAAAWLMQGGTAMQMAGPSFTLFAVVILFGSVLSVVAVVAQQAVTFSTDKIKPDLKKIDPLKNAKKKFGAGALVEFAKGTAKMGFVIVGGLIVARHFLPEMIASTGAHPALLFGEMRDVLLWLLALAVGLAGAATTLELPFKQAEHKKKLRMSHQEVKDEAKENEGDPQNKRMRQDLGRQIAMGQQLADVPKADVVVVNPEHYAVALTWDRMGGEVPRCVAKGTDHLALRIRTIAREADVPIYRDVPTARSLHASVEVGEEIRREHYEAVAAAIRFADTLRRKKKGY